MQLLDRTFFVYVPIHSSHVSPEALQRILGITPAFMRPRMSLPIILSDVATNSLLQLTVITTISFVKKLVLEEKRSLYGISSAFRSDLSSIHSLTNPSSLDSDGATPQQSNKRYDKIVAQHPSSILALNHETYSEFTARDPMALLTAR